MRASSTGLWLVALLAMVPSTGAAQDACRPPAGDDPSAALARTDHDVSGNRIARGCGPLSGAVTDVELGGIPAWVLPDPTDRGRSWLVVLEDGRVEHVISEVEEAAWVSQTELPPLPPGVPPLAAAVGDDQLVVGGALSAAGWFEAPLPDARVTEIAGRALVALTSPTDRYAHGVLGDELEAATAEVRDEAGLATRIEVGDGEVIEGTSAMVVDLREERPGPELLVTVSDATAGARLRAYALDGVVVAESAAIGQGFRWLHQIAVAPIGPGGEAEIVVVRTPHIGGVVEAYRLDDERLELVAAQPGYSSHQLGSANLDMALLADVDGDGRLDVVVPAQDMRDLGVLARTAEGFEETERLVLAARLSTNVSATPDADGRLVIAAGTADGRLRIFR